MNWYIIFLLTLIRNIKCDVQYESDYFTGWGDVFCNAGTNYTQTITFSQQFSRVPQVTLNPMTIQLSRNSANGQIGYYLEVSQITTANFIITLQPQAGTLRFLTLYWIAVDDKRIEILSNFNVANPQSVPLKHNNVNANTGIIFFTSFLGKSKLDFTLGLGTINATTVEVNIVQAQNLTSLGYIVILGPNEFFNIEPQVIQSPKDRYDSNVYTSRVVQKEINKIWLFFLQYFTFTVNADMRYRLSPTFTSTTSQYEYSCWGGSDAFFSQGAHQCATLNFALSQMKPMLLKKIRIQGLIMKELNNTIEFSITEVNKTYTLPVENDYILVPPNQQTLTFKLAIKCIKNYQITASLYQCPQCASKYQRIVRYCYNFEVAIQFFATYSSQNHGYYQQLYVSMTATQVTIYQTILNQVSQTIQIGQFDFQ